MDSEEISRFGQTNQLGLPSASGLASGHDVRTGGG